MAIITLLSDFGTSDSYVAQMKGRILSLCPEASVVDISHDIRPQDIRQGAWVLREAVAAFPPDTIHVAVVDPGVGTKRKRLIIEARVPNLYDNSEKRAYFIGPDNGLLTLAAPIGRRAEVREVLKLETAAAKEKLSTFDGRDIFAPSAAMLARGSSPSTLGPLATNGIIEITEAKPLVNEDGSISGEIVHFDHFGNAVSNISAEMLPERFVVSVSGSEAMELELASSYDSIPSKTCGVLVNSSRHLELAAQNRSAEHELGLELGREVRVLPRLKGRKV